MENLVRRKSSISVKAPNSVKSQEEENIESKLHGEDPINLQDSSISQSRKAVISNQIQEQPQSRVEPQKKVQRNADLKADNLDIQSLEDGSPNTSAYFSPRLDNQMQQSHMHQTLLLAENSGSNFKVKSKDMNAPKQVNGANLQHSHMSSMFNNHHSNMLQPTTETLTEYGIGSDGGASSKSVSKYGKSTINGFPQITVQGNMMQSSQKPPENVEPHDNQQEYVQAQKKLFEHGLKHTRNHSHFVSQKVNTSPSLMQTKE